MTLRRVNPEAVSFKPDTCTRLSIEVPCTIQGTDVKQTLDDISRRIVNLEARPTTTTSGGTANLSNYVPITRTVNGHALSANVTVTTTDIGAVPTSRTVNGHALSSNVTVTKADVGLGNADNTSDINKPVSTAQAAAIAAAVAGAGIPTSWSWTMGGSAYNYTTDPNYSPTLEYNPFSYSVSGLLGDGTIVPRFWINYRSNVAALARTSTGLRLNHVYTATTTGGNYAWPNTGYGYGSSPTYLGGDGCAIVIPLPLFGVYTRIQIDFSLQTNYQNVGSFTGFDYTGIEISICRTAGVTQTNTFRPERFFTYQMFRYGGSYSGNIGDQVFWMNNYDITGAGVRGTRDISGAPYTVAGITHMDYRIVIDGPIIRLYNCAHGGTLVEQSSTTWPSWLMVPRVEAITFATGKSINDGDITRYFEVQNLSITATKI